MTDNELRIQRKKERLFLSHAKTGKIEALKQMIWDGEVNIHCLYKEHYTSNGKDALHYAMKHGHIELARYLLNIGFNITHAGNGSGLITSVSSRLHYDIIDLLIERGWSKSKIHTTVSVNFIGCDKFEKLVTYSNHYKIDPIEIAVKHWKKELPRVTESYRLIIEEKIKSEPILRKKYRREENITKLIETS